MGPLVSCIMPTYNRRGFIPHALHYWERQDYDNKELLVLDDGIDPVEDLIPNDSRIQYVRLLPPRMRLGAKLNYGCSQVAGRYIALWDDDDWYSPSRLTRQVRALEAGFNVCGCADLLYYDIVKGKAFRYRYPTGLPPFLLGSTQCFTHEQWVMHPFMPIDVGSDLYFVRSVPKELVHAISGAWFSVHIIHRSNIDPKNTGGRWWEPFPIEDFGAIMGDDWQYYAHPLEGVGLRWPLPR